MSALLLAGCGTSSPPTTAGTSGEVRQLGPESDYQVQDNKDAQIYWRSLKDVASSGSALWFSEDLVEHLPNQLFSINGKNPVPISTGVVVGRVVKVTPGHGFVESPDGKEDEDRNDAVGFDDPNSIWRIARVHIEVDQWFAQGPAPKTVVVGGFVAHPAGEIGDAEVRGLAELGEVIVAFDEYRTFDWDKDVRVVARGGALLGDVDEAGEIGFPALGEDSASFVNGVRVADLREAWSRKPATIRISVDDNLIATRE
ncbi:hypothetical protein ACLM5J_12810 [Nocardioides sp. Bht2]